MNGKDSLFYRQDSSSNSSAGAIVVLLLKDSVSWHHAIPRKGSLCQENCVLLVV